MLARCKGALQAGDSRSLSAHALSHLGLSEAGFNAGVGPRYAYVIPEIACQKIALFPLRAPFSLSKESM